MRIVIPSRKRVESCAHALTLFPDALVCVAANEENDYKSLGVGLLIHPDNVAGIGPLRQWILDNVDDETVVMVDDDVYEVRTPVGEITKSHTLRDPLAIEQILLNAEEMAKGLETPVFGFDQTGGDVRKFKPHDPLRLNSWTGGVIGIIGRELRYDTTLLLRADIDYCLKAMFKYRVVCIDTRYSFVHKRFKNRGGNDHMRSSDRNALEIERLLARWGKWLNVERAKTTLKLKVKVKRRQ